MTDENLQIVLSVKEDLKGFREFMKMSENARKDTVKTIKKTEDLSSTFKNDLSKSLKSFASSYGPGAMAVGTITAIGAAFKGAIGGYVDFEKRMSNVNTLLNVSKKEIKGYEKEIMGLSDIFGNSSEALADGLYDVVSAGVKGADQLRVLGLAGKAAKAGVTETNVAVQAGVSNINAYGLEMKDLNKIYDLQFQTVKNGIIKYGELSGSMGNVLSSASKAEVKLETLYGSIAFLTKRSLGAEEATTALARAFDAISTKSDKFKELLGIDVYDSSGGIKDFSIIVGELADSLDGLTTKEKDTIFEALGFDIRASRAIVNITKNVKAFREEVEKMHGAAGSYEEAYKKATDNIGHDFSILTANIKNDWKELVQELENPIRVTIQATTEFVSGSNDLFKMMANPPSKEEVLKATGLWMGYGDPIEWLKSAIKGTYKATSTVAEDFYYSQDLRKSEGATTPTFEDEMELQRQQIESWKKGAREREEIQAEADQKEREKLERLEKEINDTITNINGALGTIDVVGSILGESDLSILETKLSTVQTAIQDIYKDDQVTDVEKGVLPTLKKQLQELEVEIQKATLKEFFNELEMAFQNVDRTGDLLGKDSLERLEDQIEIVKEGLIELYADNQITKEEESYLKILEEQLELLEARKRIIDQTDASISKGPGYLTQDQQNNDLALIDKDIADREKAAKAEQKAVKDNIRALNQMSTSIYQIADLMEEDLLNDIAAVGSGLTGIVTGADAFMNASNQVGLIASALGMAAAGAGIGVALGGNATGSSIGSMLGAGAGWLTGTGAIGVGIGSAAGGAIGGMFGGDDDEDEKRAEIERKSAEVQRQAAYEFSRAVDKFKEEVVDQGLAEVFETVSKLQKADASYGEVLSDLQNGRRRSDEVTLDSFKKYLPTMESNQEILKFVKSSIGSANLIYKGGEWRIDTGKGTRGGIDINKLAQDIERLNDSLIDEFESTMETIIGFTKDSIREGVKSGFKEGEIEQILTKQVEDSLLNVFTNTKIFNQAAIGMSDMFTDMISKALKKDENLGIKMPDEGFKDIKDYIEWFNKYQEVASEEINKILEELGLIPSEAKKAAEEMANSVSKAMSDALEANDFGKFNESLGESIYESVKSSLIKAFTDSAVYQKYIDKFMDLDAIENKLEDAGSFDEAYKIIQDYLNSLEDKLTEEGLDFGKTAGGSSGGASQDNSWDTGSHFEKESTQSIVNNYYMYQPEIENLFGDEKEELFEEAQEWFRKNKAEKV